MWHDLIGTPGYAAGASGTVTIPAGCVLLSVWCRSTAGGTVALFGGDAVPVIANAAPFTFEPQHTLYPSTATRTIVFTTTDSYFVHWVKQGNA